MRGEMISYWGNDLRTDIVIKKDGSTSWVEILEPSKVVNLAINDHPLKIDRM
jgi:hypothetical protein